MRAKMKDSLPVSIRMDREVLNLLEWYCEEAGQTKTTAIERAVKAYVEAYKHQQEQLVYPTNQKK